MALKEMLSVGATIAIVIIVFIVVGIAVGVAIGFTSGAPTPTHAPHPHPTFIPDPTEDTKPIQLTQKFVQDRIWRTKKDIDSGDDDMCAGAINGTWGGNFHTTDELDLIMIKYSTTHEENQCSKLPYFIRKDDTFTVESGPKELYNVTYDDQTDKYSNVFSKGFDGVKSMFDKYAISPNGNWAVGNLVDNRDIGKIMAYARAGSSWTFGASRFGSSPQVNEIHFGKAFACSTTQLFVGSDQTSSDAGLSQGVYVMDVHTGADPSTSAFFTNNIMDGTAPIRSPSSDTNAKFGSVITCSHDGSRLAISDMNASKVYLYMREGSKIKLKQTFHSETPFYGRFMDMSPNGKFLAICSGVYSVLKAGPNYFLDIVDTDTLKVMQTITQPDITPIDKFGYTVSVSNDALYLTASIQAHAYKQYSFAYRLGKNGLFKVDDFADPQILLGTDGIGVTGSSDVMGFYRDIGGSSSMVAGLMDHDQLVWFET